MAVVTPVYACTRRLYRCITGECTTQYPLCRSYHKDCTEKNPYWCPSEKYCVQSDDYCLRPCYQKDDIRKSWEWPCEAYPGKCAVNPFRCPPPCNKHGRIYRCSDGSCKKSENWCYECPQGHERCRSSGACFPGDERCDGVQFCTDGTDERNCKGDSGTWGIASLVVAVVLCFVFFCVCLYCGHHRKKVRRRRGNRAHTGRNFVRDPGEALTSTVTHPLPAPLSRPTSGTPQGSHASLAFGSIQEVSYVVPGAPSIESSEVPPPPSYEEVMGSSLNSERLPTYQECTTGTSCSGQNL